MKIFIVQRVCIHCKTKFLFNNKLHRHLRQRACQSNFFIDSFVKIFRQQNFILLARQSESVKIFYQSIKKIIFNLAAKTSAKIIIFFVSINIDFDYEFRKWHYVQIQIIHAVDFTIFIVEKYFDFDCTMSLMNRNFLTTVSHDEIRTTTQSIRVRDIDFRQHDNSKYVKLKFYIRDKTIIDKSATIHFRREMHVVNDLKIKILIDINIIESEIIDVLMNNNILHIESCDVIAFIIIKFKNNDEQINRIIRVITIVIISSHFTITIIVKFRDKSMSIDRNYFFHFISNVRLESNNEFFVYIVDVNVDVVQIRNATNKFCIISRNVKIDKLHDFEKKNCYVVDSKNRHLATITVFSWIIKLKHLTILELVIFVDVKKIITENEATSFVVSVSKLKKFFFHYCFCVFNQYQYFIYIRDIEFDARLMKIKYKHLFFNYFVIKCIKANHIKRYNYLR